MQSASELVEPRSADQAAAALAEAARAGQSVSLDRPGGDVVVSTASLRGVLEHQATDLTCIVEPGLRLSELDAVLAEHGQRLALDPPGDPTVSECILNALSGPLRHRYGAVRDLILGVTVALPDGTVASSGGKVVKNVAGYDLAKVFCGSRGSLGLVVRAALRLHPRPEAAATVSVPVERPGDAREIVRKLQRSKLVTSALDVEWPGRVLALLEGSPRVVAAQVEEAERIVGAGSVAADVWLAIRQLQHASAGVLAFAPGELDGVLRSEDRALVRPTVGAAYVARAVGPETSPPLHALQERVRRAFDPEGVLVV